MRIIALIKSYFDGRAGRPPAELGMLRAETSRARARRFGARDDDDGDALRRDRRTRGRRGDAGGVAMRARGRAGTHPSRDDDDDDDDGRREREAASDADGGGDRHRRGRDVGGSGAGERDDAGVIGARDASGARRRVRRVGLGDAATRVDDPAR